MYERLGLCVDFGFGNGVAGLRKHLEGDLPEISLGTILLKKLKVGGCILNAKLEEDISRLAQVTIDELRKAEQAGRLADFSEQNFEKLASALTQAAQEYILQNKLEGKNSADFLSETIEGYTKLGKMFSERWEELQQAASNLLETEKAH